MAARKGMLRIGDFFKTITRGMTPEQAVKLKDNAKKIWDQMTKKDEGAAVVAGRRTRSLRSTTSRRLLLRKR
ncbi:hypothetical protein EJB05_49610 [Eragrostis curvula]|uniref:Uncharacterized protein n=1 Tax=Eragrostis curvula TaxID=38414 RepID=A0A5J9T602_9POAL|nr:hypothetical protein EJB05_49610 [Eragrostis curvula]